MAGQLLGGASATALDRSVYDWWLRSRAPAPASPALLVVVRDSASEAQLGAGSWDRAVLARLITGIARGGAVAIGVDIALGQPSAPGRGGASSDALLAQATALASNIVYSIRFEPAGGPAESRDTPGSATQAHQSWVALPISDLAKLEARSLRGPLPGLAQRANSVGHTLASVDSDGIVRRVPLFARVGERAVPAFGLALATAVKRPGQIVVSDRRPRGSRLSSIAIPVDGRERALVGYARGLSVVPFADVWTAIEERQGATLQRLVDGRIVLVLFEPTRREYLTPLGAMSDAEIQAHLLNTLLTESWLGEAPAVWTLLCAVLLSWLTAWLWLALRWWRALVAVTGLALAYAAGLPLSMPLAGLVLPVWPGGAMVVASAGALLWSQLASAYRIRHLEGEVQAIREALVLQESAVEALEEDLEAARAAAARSADAEEALQAQLATARAQEAETRARLAALEREAHALEAIETRPAQVADAEQERLERECERVGIVTRDPTMLGVFRDLEKAARSSLPILVLGEPGTGKELFARAAHRLGPRAGGPFVAVNMAAISPELFESELFGHVRGSFTGAVGDRRGYFEQAERGTIFLDEVGELRPEHQSKLLRVLQDKSFYRVGAARPTTVDVRVVAASNKDLERGIAEGWFREDLYFRLKGLVLQLPPLRARRHDIRLLAARLLHEAAAELGRPALPLSEAALAALERHDWPGNVRELQHCLRQAVALSEGTVIAPEDLRLPGPQPARDDGSGDPAVLACLRRNAFDMRATARALGWDRSTVTQRLKGLGFRALVESGGDPAKAALALAQDPALGRTVELKLRDYYEHLLRAVQGFDSPESAIAACRRRFKNLPERHFRSLELLVRQHFERQATTARA